MESPCFGCFISEKACDFKFAFCCSSNFQFMEDTHTHAVGNKLSCSKALAFFTWKFLSSTKVYSPRTSLLPLFYSFRSLKMQIFNHSIRFCNPLNRQHSIQSSLQFELDVSNKKCVSHCTSLLWMPDFWLSTVQYVEKVCMVLNPFLFQATHRFLSRNSCIYVHYPALFHSVVILKKANKIIKL